MKFLFIFVIILLCALVTVIDANLRLLNKIQVNVDADDEAKIDLKSLLNLTTFDNVIVISIRASTDDGAMLDVSSTLVIVNQVLYVNKSCSIVGNIFIIRLNVYGEGNKLLNEYQLPIELVGGKIYKPTENQVNMQECSIEKLTILPSNGNIQIYQNDAKITNMFVTLYNKINKNLMLIKYKNTINCNQCQYNLIVLCANSYDISKININFLLDASNSLLNLTINNNQIDKNQIKITNNAYQIAFSVPYDLTHTILQSPVGMFANDYESLVFSDYDDRINEGVSTAKTTSNALTGQFTFIEKYLLKQDKLNNTIWIYEELKIETVLAYLTISNVNTNAAIIEIKTNLNDYYETKSQQQMTFQLVKYGDNSNIYALKLFKRIDREQIDYYDLKIELKLSNKQDIYSKDVKSSYLYLRICLIDINDNIPIFKKFNSLTSKYENISEYKFNLSENHIYYNFGQVYAYDRDLGMNAEIEYEIIKTERGNTPFDDDDDDSDDNKGNVTTKSIITPIKLENVEEQLFVININNGYLSLNKKLDYEKYNFYKLTIRAMDKGRLLKQRNFITIEINVLDENDNAPIFPRNKTYKFTLRENKPIKTLISNCKAIDIDRHSKTAYYIRPIEVEKLFEINFKNGNLLSKKKFDADIIDDPKLRDAFTNEYKFKLYAKDAQRDDLPHDSIDIVVKIDDVNDNEPFISENSLNTSNIYLNLINKTSNDAIDSVNLGAADNDFTRLPINFEILSIRKLNFNFIHDILKQQQQQQQESSNQSINYFESLIEFIDNLKQQQQQEIIKSNVFQQNLTSLFHLLPNVNNRVTLKLNSQLLSDNSLNYGLYNISIKYTDSKIQSDDLQFSKYISFKAFLTSNSIDYNTTATTTTTLTNSRLEFLMNQIELWHNKYFKSNWYDEYASNYNKSNGILNELLSSSRSENSDNSLNSNDFLLNNIHYYQQDYLKSTNFNLDSSVNDNSGIREYYRNFNLNNNKYSFIMNSNLIIILITIFVIISIMLIVIISYKHYKSIQLQNNVNINHRNNRYYDKKDDQNKVTPSNSTSSSASASPSSNEILKPNIKKSCLKSFDTKSNISLSSSSNTTLLNQKNCTTHNNNANVKLSNKTATLNKNEHELHDAQKEYRKSDSMILSTSRLEDLKHMSNANVISSPPSMISQAQTVGVIANVALATPLKSSLNSKQLNPTKQSKLITYTIPTSKKIEEEETQVFEIKQQKSEILTTTTTTTTMTTVNELIDDHRHRQTPPQHQNDHEDNGYCGSSDYSDSTSINNLKKLHNNSNNNNSIVENRNIYTVKTDFSSPQSSSTTSSTSETQPTTPLSTASSSPSFITNQTKQHMCVKTNTNLNPLLDNNIIKTIPNTKADVKIYFERFERIYNSASTQDDVLDVDENLNDFSKRNSLTTYSYV